MSLISMGNIPGRPPGAGKTGKDDSDELYEMRRRFEHVCSVDQENRDAYVKNVRISSSANQWDDEVKKRRGANRPALTFNLLNPIVKNIIGDYRQNKLAIKILPSGGEATEEVADIIASIIRGIEMDSHAEHAYTNALECSARGGFGYFRILSEYESDDVFNQKLVIKPIYNPLTVYCDPMAKAITREDAEYYFITEMISKDEFRRQYPKAEEMGWDIVDTNSDSDEEWSNDKEIRLCEYFTKKRVDSRLVAFDSGAVIQIDDDKEIAALEQIGWHPVKERQAERINIKWQKCNASHILEEKIYKTKYIPIVPVLGEEVNVEGKTHLRSAVYYSIDAQHSYNYERSAAIERSALSAKAPWKATLKEIEMFRDQWDKANTNPAPYLLFTPDAQHNGGAGPERIEPPSPSAADIQNSQAAAQDVQRTSGVFDAQLGEKSNVLSGVGLSEQQSQGATTTFIFPDNLKTGIEYGGRILVDWIPFVYDRERVVRTISTEDDIEMQTVNQQKTNPILGITEVLNDITVGHYDVVVSAGKAFASRRREAVDGMMTFAKNFPQQAPLIADLMIENMDVPGGEVMAERIKRSLPPQVVNDPDSPEGQQAAQAAQAQQAQQQQMMQQVMQSKLQVEQGKNQASMVKSQADVIKSQAEVTKAKADTIQAIADTHNTAAEHAANVLDNSRMGQPSSAGAVQPTPSQAPAPATPQPNPDMEMIKHGLGAMAEHMAKTHQETQQNTARIHDAIGGIAQKMQQHEQAIKAISDEQKNGSNALLAHTMATLAKVNAAPQELLRDKTGRATGSRKVISE